jgi:two-component system nitrate/nitrite response regulator NarL
VALLDVRMPGLDGLAILNAVTRDGLPTAVVLLSADASATVVFEAIAQGARGFLTKEADRDEICDAVAAAARGETRLPVDVQGKLVEQVRLRATDSRPRLSPREQEVLELIAEGLSAPSIAERLVLSTTTVKSHLQTLYDKLGVNDRAAAVASAMRQGFLE